MPKSRVESSPIPSPSLWAPISPKTPCSSNWISKSSYSNSKPSAAPFSKPSPPCYPISNPTTPIYATWLDYVQGYRAGAVLPPLPEAQSQEERFYLTSRQIYSQYYGIKAQEERLRKYTIRAPYAGIITATQIDLGSYATPGQPLGTIIHRYQYELETGVDLKVASTLRMGDRVTFRSNEMPGSWVGKVLRNTNVVDPQTQNVSVFFRLEGKGLRPGMYLEGAYHSQTLEDVVAIPNRVLARDQSVLLLRDDVIVRQAVEPVEYLGDSLLIRGLHDGDLLILNQFDLPVEGNKIKI